MTIIETLSEYIATNCLWDASDAGLNEDTPLLELNIIDSTSLLGLVHFLRAEFGVSISFDQVVPENFESIRAIARLVEQEAKT
jgi:acyl carrier protein